MSRGGPIPETPPDPRYLDAFLQGARFALFALEGKLNESDEAPTREVRETIGEFHDLFSSTREGIEAREPVPELTEHYLGKN